MKSKIFLALAIVSLGAYSCVSPKKLQESEAKVAQLNGAQLTSGFYIIRIAETAAKIYVP